MAVRAALGRVGAILVVGATVAVTASSCASSSSSGAQAFDGHQWRVTEVEQLRSPRSDVRVSATEHAWIAFDGRGRLTAYDLLDHYTLSYRRAGGGFIPSGSIASAEWVTHLPPHGFAISRAITDVIGDWYHPVKVTRTSPKTITMTAYFHTDGDGRGWHPAVVLHCVREDRKRTH